MTWAPGAQTYPSPKTTWCSTQRATVGIKGGHIRIMSKKESGKWLMKVYGSMWVSMVGISGFCRVSVMGLLKSEPGLM